MTRLFWLPYLGAGLLMACSSPGPSAVSPTNTDVPSIPDAAIGRLADASAGMVAGVIGLSHLTIDPGTLRAEITTPHLAATQGDVYHLSVRPFFGPRDIAVAGVTRGPGDTIEVAVKFSHPFAAPADLTPPATASKRIDLHIFDVTAMVITSGSDSFFGGSVIADATLLQNADGYRDPGATFDRAAYGAASTTIFPYKLVSTSLNPGDPVGNYNSAANGWTDSSLLAPTGYDVFPQGGAVTVPFQFALDGDPISLTVVTVAKYMDPRSTPTPKNKRLPVPGDPAALQYLLPEAAGDIQQLGVTVVDELISNSSTEIATVNVSILDWDHGAAVASSFPNPSNLSEIRQGSDVDLIELSAPDLSGFAFPGGALTGTAPEIGTAINVSNADLFTTATDTEVLGLLRVTDSQDANPYAITLDETLTPVTGINSTRYQVVRIPVTVPTTSLNIQLDPFPVPGAINSDMGTASLFTTVTNCPDIVETDGLTDVYCALRRTAGAGLTGWYVYRSIDGGLTWPTPATQITAIAGTGNPGSTGHDVGVLANGLPALSSVTIGTIGVGYVAAQSEAGPAITWGPSSNGVMITTGGSWFLPNVLPSPTDPNRVYLIAKNQSSTTGLNPNGITIWLSLNGASANPTFTSLGRVDTIDGPVTAEYDPIAHVDSTGDIHVTWLSSILAATDEVMYRKFNDDGSPSGGTWDAPEISLTDLPFVDGSLEDLAMSLNNADEPAIAVMNDPEDDNLSGDVILTKYNTGTGWTAPQIVNDLTYPNANSFRKFAFIAFDPSDRIHILWKEDGFINAADEVYATVFTADGLTKMVPDFEIFSANSTIDDFDNARIEYLPGPNKMLVTCYAVSATLYPDGRYRYRTYSF